MNSGVLITCFYLGKRGVGGGAVNQLIGELLWTEAFTAAAVTASRAPGPAGDGSAPGFSIFARTAGWISYGPEPDAQNGPRMFVDANASLDVLAKPGDRVAWRPA